MRVRDVMTSEPGDGADANDLHDAQAHMIAANCRRLPVVTRRGASAASSPTGICGWWSIRPLILRERWQDEMLMQHTTVDACMTPDPICIGPDAPLQDAINLLLANQISGLPVVERDQVVGVISVTDLMRTLVRLLG